MNKILSRGSYLNLKQQGYNLLLVPTAEGCREADRLMDKRISIDRALHDLLESHLNNGWELLDPDEIGALTEAPILANSDEVYRNANGEVVLVGKIYYFEKYMIVNEIEEFARGKSVLFNGFGKSRPEANVEYIDLREQEDREQKVNWQAFFKKYSQ